MEDQQKRAAFAILEYLKGFVDGKSVNEDEAESLSVALQCISEVFGVSLENKKQEYAYSIAPITLASLIQEHAFKKESIKDQDVEPSDDIKAEAERLKTEGNRRLVEKKFVEAIDLYTSALSLSPKNVVYLSNRAAAYSQSGQHENAVKDCLKAVDIDPSYSKAYSRLGLAYYSLGKFEDAISAYKKGLQLDPNNAIIKQSLATAEQHVEKSEVKPTSTSRAANQNTEPDLGSILNNPALMQMASQVLQNPQMSSMLQGMLGQGGTGGLNEMMNNPQLRNMAQQFMSDPSALQNMLGNLGGNPK